ncbi:MAG: hypothetical protein IKE65_01125 [Clostridia bacterium]|nr:hypothetical protein [Clostridia bacterium]
MGRGSQLSDYQRELLSIIRELESIEDGLRKDFKNVGNDKCADYIHTVIQKYYSAYGTLCSVSPSHIDRMVQASIDAKAALNK